MTENLLEMRNIKGMPSCMIIFINRLDAEERNDEIWLAKDVRDADIQLARLRNIVEKYEDNVWCACLEIMEYSKRRTDADYWFYVLKLLRYEMESL